MMANAASEVNKRIAQIFSDRTTEVFLLANTYSKACLDEFQSEQKTGAGVIGKYWHNRTGLAADRMFAEPIEEGTSIGWFMAHTMDYGVYLELCNNRDHEAIRPLVEKWGALFIAKVRELYGDGLISFTSIDVVNL